MKVMLLPGRILAVACLCCDLAVLCLGWLLPKERIWSLLDALLAGIGALFSARLSVSGGVAAMLLGLAGIMALHYLLLWYVMVGGCGTVSVVSRNSPPNAPSRLGGRPLSALALHFLWNKCRVTPRGILAALVDLSTRDCCSLSGYAGSGFAFSRSAVAAGVMAGEERALLAVLPRRARLTRAEAGVLSAAQRVCERFLRAAYPQGWRMNLLLLFPPFAASLSCAYELFGWFGLSVRERVLLAAYFCILTAAILVLWHALRLLRSDSAVFVRRGRGLLLVAISLCALPWYLSVLWSGLLAPAHVALAEALLLMPLVAGPRMGAPSPEVAALRREIAGLARYIRTGEGVDKTAAPEELRELFTRLLPYAVALGLEKIWSRHFALASPRTVLLLPGQASADGTGDLAGVVFAVRDLADSLDSPDSPFFGDGDDFAPSGDGGCDGGGGD